MKTSSFAWQTQAMEKQIKADTMVFAARMLAQDEQSMLSKL